jgi:hypothetical protein
LTTAFSPQQVLNILLLFASFSRLRFSEPELDRPYRVPLVTQKTSVRLLIVFGFC